MLASIPYLVTAILLGYLLVRLVPIGPGRSESKAIVRPASVRSKIPLLLQRLMAKPIELAGRHKYMQNHEARQQDFIPAKRWWQWLHSDEFYSRSRHMVQRALGHWFAVNQSGRHGYWSMDYTPPFRLQSLNSKASITHALDAMDSQWDSQPRQHRFGNELTEFWSQFEPKISTAQARVYKVDVNNVMGRPIQQELLNNLRIESEASAQSQSRSQPEYRSQDFPDSQPELQSDPELEPQTEYQSLLKPLLSPILPPLPVRPELPRIPVLPPHQHQQQQQPLPQPLQALPVVQDTELLVPNRLLPLVVADPVSENSMSNSEQLVIASTLPSAFGALSEVISLPVAAVLVPLAEHPETSTEVLAQLAAHPHPEVRQAVVDNKRVSLETLRVLASDRDADVRYGLASNANVDREILEVLCLDENPYVAARASKTIRRLDALVTPSSLSKRQSRKLDRREIARLQIST